MTPVPSPLRYYETDLILPQSTICGRIFNYFPEAL